MAFGEFNPISDSVYQSPPVDTSAPYDTVSLAGKTIVITGGAAGFGAGFARRWAQHGAHIAIGDIDDDAGEALVAELRATTPGGKYHHYCHCDVTSWDSQVAFFRAAIEHSATGTIHAVVPNAGVSDHNTPVSQRGFENPAPLQGAGNDDAERGGSFPDPRRPGLAVAEVNITGVLYSVHLALYWLARGKVSGGDRHILLLSSIAGLLQLPGQALYTASKHAVTGLFRALRTTAYVQEGGSVRVNMLCPYFVDTNIMPTAGVVMLAGSGKAQVEDVVEAGTRFMADESLVGRALVIGPRMLLTKDGGTATTNKAVDLMVDGNVKVVGAPPSHGAGAGGADANVGSAGQAIWECYAEDFSNSEIFVNRYIRMLNVLTMVRGWTGFFSDVFGIFWKGRQVQPKVVKQKQ